MVICSLRGNQLPVSDARWQHGSQLCFCNFYKVKNHKIAKNSTTIKAKKAQIWNA